MERRVVVTGMGCLSPLGNDVASTWCAIKAGKSGIGPITRFDASRIPVRFAGELKDFDPTTVMDRKEARRMDRFQQVALAARRRGGSQCEPGDHTGERRSHWRSCGIRNRWSGVAHRGVSYSLQQGAQPDQSVPDHPDGRRSRSRSDLHSSWAKGPNFSTVSACATGAHAIGEAAEIIRRDQADVMLAGGSEAGIVEIGVAGFCQYARAFDAERRSGWARAVRSISPATDSSCPRVGNRGAGRTGACPRPRCAHPRRSGGLRTHCRCFAHNRSGAWR